MRGRVVVLNCQRSWYADWWIWIDVHTSNAFGWVLCTGAPMVSRHISVDVVTIKRWSSRNFLEKIRFRGNNKSQFYVSKEGKQRQRVHREDPRKRELLGPSSCDIKIDIFLTVLPTSLIFSSWKAIFAMVYIYNFFSHTHDTWYLIWYMQGEEILHPDLCARLQNNIP